MLKTYALVAATAVVGLVAGTWWASREPADAFADCAARGVIRGSDAFGGPFTLTDQTGATVTDAELLTKPTLIYFGYTACPDICPFDAARNAAAVDLLAEAGHDVQSVFVSVDPGRDTPEVLAEYVGFMHPEMIGLTGTSEQVEIAASAYNVLYSIGVPEEEGGFYPVAHSGYTYLHVPERGVVAIFGTAAEMTGAGGAATEGVTEDTVAGTTACLLEAS